MVENESTSEKMTNTKSRNIKKHSNNNLLAVSGATALLALAVSLGYSALNHHFKRKSKHHKDLRGSNVRVNLSAPEILKLADSIIAKSKLVRDTVTSVRLDKVMLGLPLLEGTNPASCFPRSVIGYEAACYSRIWSEVFAADILVSKFRDDPSNQFVGMQFRNKIFTSGGAKEPMETLLDFLGREPSIRAFIDRKAEYSL